MTSSGGPPAQSDPADGSVAATSSILPPAGLAIDGTGNVIYADCSGHKVRMINPSGILTTLAGTGVAGTSGDGGPAKAAQLSCPIQVLVAADGSLYVTDSDGASVRKIATTGVISTVAGTGVQRYHTTPPDPRALSEPQSVALSSSGTLYVGEFYRGIRQLMPDGTLQLVVSGGPDIATSVGQIYNSANKALAANQGTPNVAVVTERPRFSNLALGSDGTFYTNGPQGVLTYAPVTAAAAAGSVSSARIYAGANPASPPDCSQSVDASTLPLIEASAMTFDASHRLVVADWMSLVSNQLVVHQITPGATSGFTSRALYGCDSPSLLAGLNPNALLGASGSIGGLAASPDGSFYLAVQSSSRILKLRPDGSIVNIAGTGSAGTSEDGDQAATSPINVPNALALGSDGSLYFLEYPYLTAGQTAGSRLRRISASGVLSTIVGTGVPGDSGEGQAAVSAQIRAANFALSPDGRIFLADTGNAKIKMVDTQGLIHTIAGSGQPGNGSPGQPYNTQQPTAALQTTLNLPTSIAVTNDGTVYYVDYVSSQVIQLKQHTTDNAWDLSVLFGVKRTSDCSTASAQGSAAAGSINAAIQASLSVVCEGVPVAITIQDTCPSANGAVRIAITQTVSAYANIVDITKPCGT